MKIHLFYVYNKRGELFTKYYAGVNPNMREGDTRATSLRELSFIGGLKAACVSPEGLVAKCMGEHDASEIDAIMGDFASE